MHDDADGFGVAHVEGVQAFGEVCLADEGVEEDGLVEVAEVGDVVHQPDELAGGVVGTSKSEVESHLRLGDVHLVGGNSDVKSRVAAGSREEVTRGVDVRLGLRVDALVGLLVEDLGLDGGGDAGVQAAASLALWAQTRGTFVKSHPHSLVGVIATLDDDLSALADGESDHVSLVRLNGDEVVGDHGHVVTIDAEEEDGLGTVVDQAEQVLLASLELESREVAVGSAGLLGLVARVRSLAVDEHVISSWREDRSIPGGVVNLLEKVLVVIVEPIGKHDGADIDVPIVSSRAVNNNRA